jgi:hypothetical protein
MRGGNDTLDKKICLFSEAYLFVFYGYPIKSYAASTFTAQTLYSGIFPIGSRAGLVNRFTDASAKWKFIKIEPGALFLVMVALASTVPRREVTLTNLSPTTIQWCSAEELRITGRKGECYASYYCPVIIEE